MRKYDVYLVNSWSLLDENLSLVLGSAEISSLWLSVKLLHKQKADSAFIRHGQGIRRSVSECPVYLRFHPSTMKFWRRWSFKKNPKWNYEKVKLKECLLGLVLCHRRLSHHFQHQHPLSEHHLWSQLLHLTTAAGQAAEDGPSAREGIPALWLPSGQEQTVAAIWGVNLWIKDSVFCLYC